MIVRKRFCKVCGQQRPFEKDRVNHLLHLLFTILTVGIWSIAWLSLVLINSAKRIRCRTCGEAAII